MTAASPPPSVDRSLGGRLDTSEPYPSGFWSTLSAKDYWKKLQAFIAYVDGVLPPGFTMQNDAGGAYRSKRIPGTDANGNPIDTGSHMKVPAHDFVIRSTVPGAKMPTAAYEKLARIAQHFGIAANGSAHGTGAHLHVNAGKTKYPYIGDKKELHNETGLFMKAINAPPTPQYPSNTIDQTDAVEEAGAIALGNPAQNTHRVLDALDNAFSPEAIKEAESIVAGNPSRDISKRGALQDMQETAAVVWNNFLAGAGDLARGVDPVFLHEALTDKLTKLMEPINRELEPIHEFDAGEESGFVVLAGNTANLGGEDYAPPAQEQEEEEEAPPYTYTS